MAQQTKSIGMDTSSQLTSVAQRIKIFVVNNAPLLTTIIVFILVYNIGGRLYPAMQKPQVFVNLFINTASLMIVSIGTTLVIISKGIDLSVAGMIALTSAASAALLEKGMSSCSRYAVDVNYGDCVWVHPG